MSLALIFLKSPIPHQILCQTFLVLTGHRRNFLAGNNLSANMLHKILHDVKLRLDKVTVYMANDIRLACVQDHAVKP